MFGIKLPDMSMPDMNMPGMFGGSEKNADVGDVSDVGGIGDVKTVDSPSLDIPGEDIGEDIDRDGPALRNAILYCVANGNPISFWVNS